MKKKQMLAVLVLLLEGVLSQSAGAVQVGQAAPDVVLPELISKNSVNLKDFAGKVIYLDFWASWCAPCRVSFPVLNQLHQQLKAKGFEVIAINLDEEQANAEKFLKDIPVNFTLLRDENGKWADQFVVESMPTSFIIDKKGVVQHIHHGFTTSDSTELETKIKTLLETK